MNLYQTLINNKTEKRDLYYTPNYPLECLKKYIPEKQIIWEPASGKGHITRFFKETNSVIESDIDQGKNFLEYQPEYFDLIITNPPYSIKTQFLERAFYFKKPFAFLYPISIFETKNRISIMEKIQPEVLIMKQRVKFIKDDGKIGSPFIPSIWLCHKILPQKICYSDN